MKRKGKIMSLESFRKIIDNVFSKYKIKRLVITGFGSLC